MSGAHQVGATPRTLKEFGKELRKLINSPEVFALLSDGDWGAGGCWTLAEALAEYLGPPAEIMVVSEWRGALREPDVPVSHVVVRYGDLYVDYSGAQTRAELLRNLEKEGYENPELNEFPPELRDVAGEWGVFCDQAAKRELVSRLRRRFGSGPGPGLGRVAGADVAKVVRHVLDGVEQLRVHGARQMAEVMPERRKGWPGTFELMNGLGLVYGAAAARSIVEPLLATAAEGGTEEEAKDALASLRSLANEVYQRMTTFSPEALREAFREVRESLPKGVDPEKEIKQSLAAEGRLPIYFRDFHWNVISVLLYAAEWLERLLFFDSRRELAVFHEWDSEEWFVPPWAARLGPEETKGMLRAALREANRLAAQRSWYGPRREPLPDDPFGTVLLWLGGPAEWRVDWATTRGVPLMRRAGLTMLDLDANQVLVPFPANIVSRIAPEVDPPPVHQFSLEAKERGEYPEPTDSWVRRAVRAAIDGVLPGTDPEERALMAIEWFEALKRAKAGASAGELEAFLHTFRPWPGFARLFEEWMGRG